MRKLCLIGHRLARNGLSVLLQLQKAIVYARPHLIALVPFIHFAVVYVSLCGGTP
jgi:hypothetical protein